MIKEKEYLNQATPIFAIDDKNRIVMEFDSMNQAQTEGWRKSHVSKCCRGLQEWYKGFRWITQYEYYKRFRNYQIVS